MFWWLFKAEKTNFTDYPLVMYLQGGPGDSASGFGNFFEIGRRDYRLRNRCNSWDRHVNLLFVDSPVGVGYSQVFNDAFSLNSTMIASDLLSMMKGFLKKHPEFETVPLYIFTESYGGKAAASFGALLHQTIKRGVIKCNFKGIHLGNAAISLEDSLASWPQYLHITGMIDREQRENLDVEYVGRVRKAIKDKEGALAMNLWIEMRERIANMTSRLNLWNILDDRVPWRMDEEMRDLMNGPVKEYLQIPENLTWGTQEFSVFEKLQPDFMYSVLEEIEYLLNYSNIKIAVVSGNLDVVCSHFGTENWIRKLKWAGLKEFLKSNRQPFAGDYPSPGGYVRKYGKLSQYWIRDAGHSIPQDQFDISVEILNDITKA